MEFIFSATNSQWLSSNVFGFLLLTFTILFLLLTIYTLRRKLWCSCDVCRSFLTSGWSGEFYNLSDWYTHLLRSSPTGTIHVPVLNNVITANPDNVEHVLKTRFHNYPKGKSFSVILGDLLGHGIFAADGPSWRFQRKMASLELRSVSIRAYAMDIFTSETRHRLVPLLAGEAASGCAVDLQDVFRRFSFHNICRFSFGVDTGYLGQPVSDFAEAFDVASRFSAERALTASPVVWKVKRVLNVGSERKLREAIKVVRSLADEMIAHRRRAGFSAGEDLLSRFMCSVPDDGDSRYLRDIVVSFLLAGRDTVASGLTGLFYLLAQNPEVVSEIRTEMGRVMKPGQELASFCQLRDMHYLHAALYEAMRLYPPVQFDSKFCQEADVLPDGTPVHRGDRVTYHPYAMGRMERIWGEDCLEFKPERWLRDGVYSPESLYKYPVFQAGPRVCLGKEMAIVQIKCATVAIVKRFEIHLSGSDGLPRFVPGLTASFRGGLHVLVEAI